MFQTLPCLLVLTLGFTTGNNQVLDEFNYPSSTEVRKNWQELKGTLPLAMQKSNDQNVLLPRSLLIARFHGLAWINRSNSI